ncbi:GmrSD restriction endonuclease domain-containing protein [Rhodovulum sulfidophilum]|uniref:GmrSD restriction endonuclease domain-containing protein n=1 Tax=Rhodovulum sulfidophilum TaxID=35806 RepID=UPI0015BAFD2E|nr:DUF262 domain-containing protein [Rhodovulum sulfidophilum]MBL3553182.1 DUF262 domain-containing protein [Rhodovulum sulfidophilum]
MTLEAEIEKAARQVSTDAFSLTIGEVINLYRDGDIKINPDFQRLFRWDTERKSRLIESILVRIPLPPIFVFELGNSKWEVIDGLQRLSTILEFVGELKNPDTGDLEPPAPLIGTQCLKSLRGAFWSEELLELQRGKDQARIDKGDPTFVDNRNSYFVLESDIQRAIKRTKIGVQLLEKKSDPKSKYDLFQRLNSGGLAANDQELRNCALVMVSPEFFNKMKKFADGEMFSKMIPLGPTSIRKSNHLENLCKIMAFAFRDYSVGSDIEEFVTNAMVNIASNPSEFDEIFEKLDDALNLLTNACGQGALRPFRNGDFAGRIGRTSIEIILVGVIRCLHNIRSKQDPEGFVKGQIIAFWESEESKKYTAAGVAGTDRVQYTIPRGVEIFSK